MSVTARGRARIRHSETGEIYSVLPGELDWQQLGSDERGMGSEIAHVAEIDHPDLGSLRWELWEYPLGSENDRNTDAGVHIVVEDFSLTLDPDEAPDEVNLSVEALVEWFGERYEDPVHETPYSGREGGYQYIWGGPYDARTELQAEFGGDVSDDVIEAAVEEIESDGILEWAPGPLHPDQRRREQDYYDIEPINPESLIEIIRGGATPRFGTPLELEARASLVVRLDELELELDRLRAGMGHNGPPDSLLEFPALPPQEVQTLATDLASMRQALDDSPPDAERVGEKALAIKNNWLGQKLDKMADGAFEEFGKEVGKWGGRAAVGGIFMAAVPVLTNLIHAVFVAAFHWISVILAVS